MLVVLLVYVLQACSEKAETYEVKASSITESVYASGLIKSDSQYQVFAASNGILQTIFVSEGDFVKKGQPLFSIVNETSRLSRENAQLVADFSSYESNASKLKELKLNIDLARNKMKTDSLNYHRQKTLYERKVSSKTELEQSELAFQNSKTSYQSAVYKYADLNKQLKLNDQQAQRNLKISQKLESDFVVKSEIDGRVYSMLKEKGEMVSIQTPLAVLGDAGSFIIEMQVDENDIVKVKLGQKVIVSMDSYKGRTFEAKVHKINPYMNERSKTFTIEARFTVVPEVLYPNLSLEANIILSEKKNVLVIPRNYLIDNQYVLKASGEKVKVKIGLMDFEKVEILSGIKANDQLILPEE
jgi:RND family efflux transporter MFP subunit